MATIAGCEDCVASACRRFVRLRSGFVRPLFVVSRLHGLDAPFDSVERFLERDLFEAGRPLGPTLRPSERHPPEEAPEIVVRCIL